MADTYSCAAEMEFYRARTLRDGYDPISDVVCNAWEKSQQSLEFDDRSILVIFKNGDLQWEAKDGTSGAHLLRAERHAA
jgi:hypothetical protein